MRHKKTELIGAEEHRRDMAFLQKIPQDHGLVKANRFLLLLASALMVIVFFMGFFLMPDNIRDSYKEKKQPLSMAEAIQNPVLSAEINSLKGQLVGLISGSIESKLKVLEDSVRSGSMTDSLGTIQDLKSDLKVLKIYSQSNNKEVKSQVNEEVLKEVSQLKSLIYLTLTSCGLIVAAFGGVWIRRHYHMGQSASVHQLGGKSKSE